MATRYFGERIKRNKNPRLLPGNTLFVDDVDLPNLAYATFVRNSHAYARIRRIDKSWTTEQEGVMVTCVADHLGDH